MSYWDETREAKLKELWEKGHTASQIAELLGGTTRNAVIGKAHRLKLAGRVQSKKTDSFISLVKSKNIPLITFSSKKFRENNNNLPWKNLRNEYDNKVISKLRNFNIDFSVHAGYMLIAPILCSYYKTRYFLAKFLKNFLPNETTIG